MKQLTVSGGGVLKLNRESMPTRGRSDHPSLSQVVHHFDHSRPIVEQRNSGTVVVEAFIMAHELDSD